jgi:hypothetical protein
LAVLMLVGGVAAAGCTPPVPGGGGTTTTIAGNPAAACFDSTGHDFKYSGTPNVEGNLKEYSTTNGSCGGSLVNANGILVVADGEPQASADCFALGRVSAYSPADIGIATSATAWFCTN